MRRMPLIPTLVVGLAVAAMIALGLWQWLDRAPMKEAYLAQLARNPAQPAIAFPAQPDDRLLFRRSYTRCDRPLAQRLAGAGAAGFRLIADCGDGLVVQLGTTTDPLFKGRWSGGTVNGFISHAPDSRSLIGSLFDRRPQRLMLVADTPVLGLAANGRPDLSSVPNNHRSYAVQWFLFALVATVIYGLAVRRRGSR